MANWYIDADTGNDSTGDGSSGNPWETLSTAYTAASASDTIICNTATATYDFEQITFAKALTVTGESEISRATFLYAGGFEKWTLKSNVTIENLIFDGMIQSSTAIFTCDSTVIVAFHNCRFVNFQINQLSRENGGFFGFTFNPSTGNPTGIFTSCEFVNIKNIKTGATTSIFPAQGTSGTFTFTANLYNCIFFWDITTQTPSAIFSVRSGFPTISNIVTENCIISNLSGNTIEWHDSTNPVTSATMDYCCTQNLSNLPSGTGNITDDPLFVDAPNANFNLRPTSPALNAGTLV